MFEWLRELFGLPPSACPNCGGKDFRFINGGWTGYDECRRCHWPTEANSLHCAHCGEKLTLPPGALDNKVVRCACGGQSVLEVSKVCE